MAPGQSLLVTGAAGAVGGYAVQLAAHRGISVTGLAREGDEELVRSLGAGRFTSGAVADGSFDAVLDAAVLGEPALAWVRDGGRNAGVIPQAEPASVRGVRTDAVEVSADGRRAECGGGWCSCRELGASDSPMREPPVTGRGLAHQPFTHTTCFSFATTSTRSRC